MALPPWILHVDDDPELPERARHTLEQEGYRLAHTADAEEAMQLVERRRPALVVMELELSGCDGLDLLAGIRDASGGTPVLVLSRAERNSGLHGEAIAVGIADFLTKPVRAADLLAAIHELVQLPPKEPVREPGKEPSKLDISGDLADTPAPELLARLRRRGATGVLAMGHGSTRIGIQLRNGSPIALSSNRPQTDSGLARARRAEALLFETFRWRDGPYGFSADRELNSDVLFGIEGDPQVLVLMGVLDASPAELIRDRLAKRESLYVTVDEGRKIPVRGVKLTARQRELLAEQAGAEQLSALLESRVFDERLLYGLWVGGWIDLNTAPTVTLTDLLGAEAEAPRAAQEERQQRREAAPLPPPEPLEPLEVDEPRTGHDAADALAERVRELAKQVLTGDDFDALDLDVSATDEDVRSAYEWLMGEIPGLDTLAGAHPTVVARLMQIHKRVESAYKNLKDAEKRSSYAMLRAEERQDADAKPSAERALEGERWFRKGKARLEQRQYQDAVEAFGMAAHMDPAEGEYLAHLGYALYLTNPGQKIVQREALENVANGIKRSPRRELSYVFLGRILKAQGDLAAARKVFARALRIAPACRAAQQEMRLLEMRERKDKAKGLLSRLIKKG